MTGLCDEGDLRALFGILAVFIPTMAAVLTLVHLSYKHDRIRMWESWGGPEALRRMGMHESSRELERYRARGRKKA